MANKDLIVYCKSSVNNNETPSIPTAVWSILAAVAVPALVVGTMQQDIVSHAMRATAWLAVYEVIVIIASYADGILVTNNKGETKSRDETFANGVSAFVSGSPTLFRKRYSEYIMRRHGTVIAPSKSARLIWDYLEPSGDTGRRIVVIGGAGSGKTTLLKHVTLTLAGKTKRYPAHLPNKLPVLLFLRDHEAAIAQDSELTLALAYEDSLVDSEGIAPPQGWFEAALRDGQCVVMMDGLDEIVDEQTRKKLIAWVAKQMEMYAKSTFIITSRPWAYRSDLFANAEVLEMPHHCGGDLPARRVELLREVCEVYLLACPAKDGPCSELTAAQLQRVLELLAYQMMCRNARVISASDARKIINQILREISPKILPTDFFKRIESGTGLLLERDPGVYSFAHLGIQEYLAAVYIYDRRSEDELIGYLQSNWWHETLRLYCAISRTVTPIVCACLAADDGGLAALTFAAECIDAAESLGPDLRERLYTLAIENLESPDKELRRRAAEARLAFRILRMRHLGEDRSIDSTLVTNAEYQLFLNDEIQLGRRRQPDHWKTSEFPEGQASVPIKGVRPSDATAFCNWLSRRHSGPFLFRPPSADERGMAPISDGAGDNSAGIGFWTQTKSGNWAVSVDGRVPKSKWDLDRFRSHDTGRALDLVPAVDVADACARVRDLLISFGDTGAAKEHANELNLALRRAAGSQGALDREIGRIEGDRMQACVRPISQTLAEELKQIYWISLTMVRMAAHARYLFLPRLTQSLSESNASEATLKIAGSVESKVGDSFNTALDVFLDIEAIRAFDASFRRSRDLAGVPEYEVQTANPGDFDYAVKVAQSFNLELELEAAVNSSRIDVIASGNEKEGALESSRILRRARINADAVARILNRDRTSTAVELSDVVDARIGTFHFFLYHMYATGGFDDRLIKIEDRELYRKIGRYGIVQYNALAELQRRMENPSFAIEGIRLVKELAVTAIIKPQQSAKATERAVSSVLA